MKSDRVQITVCVEIILREQVSCVLLVSFSVLVLFTENAWHEGEFQKEMRHWGLLKHNGCVLILLHKKYGV